MLAESDDQEATSECRAALAELRDPDARQAVLDWGDRNPHERETGPFSGAELHLRHAAERVRYAMDKLRERAALLRECFPGAP